MWNVFISHASEDKELVAKPIAEGLARAGLRVWLDVDRLVLGDSLHRGVEQGLQGARFGVVILSPAFFRKAWPQRELAAILALESRARTRVLPVLHELDIDALIEKAPLVADRVSVSTAD
jgi:hypothetical protein